MFYIMLVGRSGLFEEKRCRDGSAGDLSRLDTKGSTMTNVFAYEPYEAASRRAVPAGQVGEPAATLDLSGGDDPRRLAAAIHKAAAIVSSMLDPISEIGVCPQRSGLALWQRRRVQTFIDQHLQKRVSVAEMAAVAQLSQWFFSRKFSASFGCSPQSYLRQRRIEKAKAMMRETEEPLAQIAVACGLTDQSHLTRMFHRHASCTPGSWRRLVRGHVNDE